jgi:ElaB/YqjD/DUF883 family membrane-anchored ribosome-binding protein
VVQAGLAWGALLLPTGVIVESVALSANNGSSLDAGLKVAGFLIGLAGLALVAFGLWRTRRLFGKPSLPSRVRAWLRNVRSLVIEGRRISVDVSFAVSVAFSGKASTQVTTAPKTLRQRIDELERRASAAEQKIEEARAEANQKLGELRAALLNEETNIRETIATLDKRLEEFSVGGLDLEGMGLSWLIVGSGLSTFHEEIAKWSMWRVFL